MNKFFVLSSKVWLLHWSSILIVLFGVRCELPRHPNQLGNVIHVAQDAGQSSLTPRLDTSAGSATTQQCMPNEQHMTGAERTIDFVVQQPELIAPKLTPGEESSSDFINPSNLGTFRSALPELTLESIRIDPSSSHVTNVLAPVPALSLSHSVDKIESSSLSQSAQNPESSSSSLINASHLNNPIGSSSSEAECAICQEPMSRRNFNPAGKVALHPADADHGKQVCVTDVRAIIQLANRYRSENTNLVGKSPVDEDLPISILACGHAFHTLCIAPWIKSQFPNSCTCPTCRAPLERPTSRDFIRMTMPIPTPTPILDGLRGSIAVHDRRITMRQQLCIDFILLVIAAAIIFGFSIIKR